MAKILASAATLLFSISLAGCSALGPLVYRYPAYSPSKEELEMIRVIFPPYFALPPIQMASVAEIERVNEDFVSYYDDSYQVIVLSESTCRESRLAILIHELTHHYQNAYLHRKMGGSDYQTNCDCNEIACPITRCLSIEDEASLVATFAKNYRQGYENRYIKRYMKTKMALLPDSRWN